jgi:hypothetical protein
VRENGPVCFEINKGHLLEHSSVNPDGVAVLRRFNEVSLGRFRILVHYLKVIRRLHPIDLDLYL